LRGLFHACHLARLCAFLSRQPPRRKFHANKSDHRSTEPPARQNRHEINVTPTETALHRTRLRNLDQEIISVLIFFKPPRQAALCLGLYEQSKTEKIEKNFMLFQFSRSLKDREVSAST